jgi:aryl-alcohol dehydrogenase-like predicted oxidoreductase
MREDAAGRWPKGAYLRNSGWWDNWRLDAISISPDLWITAPMKLRSFGSGTDVSVLGIGCSRVGSISNPVPIREIEAMLEAAVQAGVSLFDTADIYGQGDSERTLGRLLRRHPKQIFIVTKVGGRHGRFATYVRLAKPLLRLVTRVRPQVRSIAVAARTATVTHSFDPEALARAIDGSRRRLGMERLQGLLLHDPSLDSLQRPEVADFLADILAKGKSDYVGVSVDTFEALEAAVAIQAVGLIQAPKLVCDALPSTQILQQIRQRNIAVFVRQILRPASSCQSVPVSPQQAFSDAIAPDFVTSAIVGLSTRTHLKDFTKVVV